MTAALETARVASQRLRAVEATGLNAVLAHESGTVEALARDLGDAGRDGPLAGVVVGVKDNICTLEYPTTCGSRMLEGYQSPFEATVVTRLKAAGALIACKTNLDEFAMGSSTEYSAFGPCRHPTHADRVPGGSSGGSAALVATGAVEVALGSETGGSVRQPAAYCGVVGFKPTYGRVSRLGLIAFGSSLDQVGVFGRTVRSTAAVASVISGHDPGDSTSLAAPPIRTEANRADVKGLTIGLPDEYFPSDLHGPTRRACDRVIERLKAAGADVRPMSLPHTGVAVATYYVIAPAEASSNLARFDGVRYGRRPVGSPASVDELYRMSRGAGFGEEVKRRIIIGTYVLSAGYYRAYYRNAQRVRAVIARELADSFAAGVDLLFTPTTPGPAFRAGERVRDPIAMYLTDRFTVAANLAGLPAVSVPIGRVDGLPLGGQLIGPAGADDRVLIAAEVLERIVDGEAEV